MLYRIAPAEQSGDIATTRAARDNDRAGYPKPTTRSRFMDLERPEPFREPAAGVDLPGDAIPMPEANQ